MIHSIEIEKFRLFKNQNLKLGKRITVIAGHNATGKSTLLGLIGNMVESKEKNIFGKQYRTDFSEIFKGSKEFDQTGDHKGKINFCKTSDFNEISDFAFFRSTWQSNDRFRIIPNRKNEDGKKTESKYPLPVIYLGLSRLYPLGEAGSNINHEELSLTESEKDELYKNYKEILSLPEDIEDFSNMNVKAVKSNFTGIKTRTYDELCNSAGQDNLGQILLSFISFERLFKDSSDWDGGLLLIDEIDSTFHPSAQLRLLNFIFKKSKIMNIQIVFTTHSTTLLYYIADKYKNNDQFSEDYKLLFISRANQNLVVYKNPSKELIKNNLFVTTSQNEKINKILVYSEDDDTRWFFKKLIYRYNKNVKILNVNLGCSQLNKLLKEDTNYFSTVLFVVDGDVKITDPNFVKKKNVIALIGDKRPENILYDYLIKPSCKFWDKIGEEQGFTKRYLIDDNGPFCSKYNDKKNEREKFSSWFYDNKNNINKFKVFESWKDDNTKFVTEFRKNFISKYNALAAKQGIKPIPA